MTQTGLRWIADKAAAPYSNLVSFDDLGGSLAGGIKVGKMMITSAGYRVTLNAVELHTQLRKLLFGQLYITSLTVDSVALKPPASRSEDKPTSFEPTNFNIALPLGIDVRTLKIEHLSMDGQPSYLPRSIQLLLENMTIRSHVTIERLALSSSMGSISLSGKLPLSSNGSLNVRLSTDVRTPLVKKPVIATVTLSGKYNNLAVKSDFSSPDTVSLQGEAVNLLTSPQWNATLESPQLTFQHWINGDDSLVSNLKIVSTGKTGDFSIKANGKFTNSAFNNVGFDLSANQASNTWSIQRLALSNKQTDQVLNLHGTINTAYTFNSNTQALLSGSWKNLQWPLTQKSPNISSQQGTIEVSGSVSQYALKASGEFSASTHHFQNIRLAGTGNIDQINFTTLACDYLDGAWSGGVLVSWQDGIRWQSDLTVKHADINHLVKSIRSSLSGRIALNGSVIDSKLTIDSSIHKLIGSINNYPITAKGSIALKNDQLSIKNAVISSKNNHINTDFVLNTGSNSTFPLKQATWSINAKNLTELYPDLSGKLVSKGNYSTNEKKNEIQGSLTTDQLHYKDYSIRQFSLKLNTSKDNKPVLNATGKDISIYNYKIRDLKLHGNELLDKPIIELQATSENNTNFVLKTRINRTPLQWEVRLVNLQVNKSVVGNWSLLSQPKAIFTKTGFSTEPVCLQKQDSVDKVCLNSTTKDYQNIDISLVISHLGLDNFKSLLPPNILSVTGVVNGSAQAQYRNNAFSLSQLQLKSDKGIFEVSTNLTAKNQFEYKNLDITLSKTNRLYTITSSTHVVDAGYFKSEISFSSAYISDGDWKNNKLSGYLDVEFENLDKLSLILPVIANAKGNWSSHFTFSGTLSHPLLIGQSTLDIASVDLPASGISIKKLKVVTKSNPDGTLTIDGSAESGSGKLHVNGKLKDYSLDKFTGSMKISGDHFKIANLPEISAVVSPDLNFTLTEKQAELEGNLTIDEADIKVLSQITSMTPSPDVVIVTQSKEKSTPYPNIDFLSNVRVTLGDKVWLRGYGFEGRLNGSILVKQRPGELTKASGTINIVDGNYSAYGQSLQIDKGLLNFAGNPIDNPSVNIRAVRKINDTITVGLMITGQAQSPSIKLISEPAMDDVDTLSYIIRGYPLKSATQKDGTILSQAAASIGLLGAEKLVKRYAKYFGIDEVKVQANNTTQEASLLLGKYLSPKLYMSYAIGVGQAINTLQFQYKLSEHWVIKTESGIGQAADILFTIEK